MRTNCRRPSNKNERATGAARTSCSGPIRRPTSESSCSRRWKKKSRRAGSRKTSTSLCEPAAASRWESVATRRGLWNVLALGAPDRVFLRVPRHDENRPENDHHEDRQEDQIHQLREVARVACEDRSVEAARADDEEAAR